jgi:sugar phosphate isomerase/epimerase
MKLAFIGENDLAQVEADALFAREHGFSGLEYNYWREFRDLPADKVRQMRAIHEKHGVRASMFGMWGYNPMSGDPAVREEHQTLLNRSIEFARMLNAEVIVLGAGDLPGEPVGRKVKEFLKVWPPFLEKIEKAGLKPVFYAVHGNMLANIEVFERVWEHIDIRIKYDPANWDHAGLDYLDVVRRYGHKIGYVHIKEHLNMEKKAVSQPAAGMGSIEWGKVFAFLYEHNYSGWLSTEPHGPIWSKGAMRTKMLLLTRKYLDPFLV